VAVQFGLTQPVSDGVGYQHDLRATPPAAGANFSVVLDSRYVWRVKHCLFTLTTSSQAANRYVTVQYLFGDGNPLWVNAASVTVSANSTQRFVGSSDRGVAEWNTNTDVLFPLDKAFLRGGNTLQIAVASIDTADTLTAIYFIFDRFETDPHKWSSDESDPALQVVADG
jgi:hypothetical protein